MCVFSLPGQARAGVIGLIDYLWDSDHYFASAFDDAVEFTLDTGGCVTEEQSEGGTELILSIREKFDGPPRRHIRLAPDEARLLAEVLDNVLYYERDKDWRIVAAAEAACDLRDEPTETQYSTGRWALKRTRAKLTTPPRPSIRQGDILHVEDTGELADNLFGEGDYEVTTVSDTGLDLRGPDGRDHHIERSDITRLDADLEQRFTPPGVSVPEVPDPPPPPEPPWTDDDLALRSFIATVATARRQISIIERNVASCEAGTFWTRDPERTARKFRRQLPPWEEAIERALPQIEELSQRPTERTEALLEWLGRARS